METKEVINRDKKIILTSIIGIVVNTLLAAVKMGIGFTTHSAAIINDGINSLSDTLSSILTIIGTKLSNLRPSKKHPFGYGRIEYLTSLIIAALVCGVGVLAFKEALQAIITKEIAEYSIISLVILGIALLFKLFLGMYTRKTGVDTDSQSLVASGTESIYDCITSATTIIAAVLNMLFGLHIENFLALIISALVIKAGIELLAEALHPIIGERESPEFVKVLKSDICQYPEILGVYDVIINNYGHNKRIGSVHIEVDDDTTAVVIHRLTRHITKDIYRKYGVLLTVGVYASNTSDPEASQIFDEIISITKNIDGINQVHGFYVDWDLKVISFDIVVDFKYDSNLIRYNVIESLTPLHPDYTIDVAVDTDFG